LDRTRDCIEFIHQGPGSLISPRTDDPPATPTHSPLPTLSVMDEAYLRRCHRLRSSRDGNCFPVQLRVRLQSRHIVQMDGVGRRAHETLR
jgi:hypothetical protein